MTIFGLAKPTMFGSDGQAKPGLAHFADGREIFQYEIQLEIATTSHWSKFNQDNSHRLVISEILCNLLTLHWHTRINNIASNLQQILKSLHLFSMCWTVMMNLGRTVTCGCWTSHTLSQSNSSYSTWQNCMAAFSMFFFFSFFFFLKFLIPFHQKRPICNSIY